MQGDENAALHWLPGPRPSPRSKTLLKLYTQVLSQKGDWPAIAALLPELTKHKAMDETALHLLEETTLWALISSAAQTGLEALQNAWAGLNKSQKQAPSLLLAFAPAACKTQSRRTRRTLSARPSIVHSTPPGRALRQPRGH